MTNSNTLLGVTKCLFCSEEFRIGDAPVLVNGATVRVHRACMIRGIVGSVAHLTKRCSCFVAGSTEGDPPDMTRREAAEAAFEIWKSQRKECDDKETD